MSEDIQIATAKTWARLEQPHVWALYGHGNLLVKINLDDGSYEFGETYTLDEAANKPADRSIVAGTVLQINRYGSVPKLMDGEAKSGRLLHDSMSAATN
jgi:hypothetical protein